MNRATIEGSGYYDFTGKTKVVDGVTVRQIVATRDFGDYEKGAIGGYIQETHNLTGGAWVADEAVVMESANLCYGAFANKDSLIRGKASVVGGVFVTDNAVISGKSRLMGVPGEYGGNIMVAGSATIKDATISSPQHGDIFICGHSVISDGAIIIGERVCVKDFSIVTEHALISGDGSVEISGNAQVRGGARIIVEDDYSDDMLIIGGNEHISEPFYRPN